VSFCNTKATVTFLTATLPSHWCILLLRVADGFVGSLNHASTAEFNTTVKQSYALVTVLLRRFRVKNFNENLQ
jgi:hypothetical protein